ncbi:MAG: DNA adenine methylase [Thermoplasmata archaeon]
MDYLRIMKYPGAKTVMLPELIRIIGSSGCKTVIDVFGGSGLLSLNIDRLSVVYNDIDGELYNLFLQIKQEPVMLKHLVTQRIEDLFYPGGKQILQNRSRNEIVRKALGNPYTSGKTQNRATHTDLIAQAAETLLRFNVSFGGMGRTYSTHREKSPARYIEKTIAQFDRISSRVHNWKLENMDFRSLIKKYDSSSALFYLDPPYPGKEWYNFNFRDNDFRELKLLIDHVQARYVLNVDDNIPMIMGIFGQPTFLRSYPNMNRREGTRPEESKKKAFYLNFEDRASSMNTQSKGHRSSVPRNPH